MENALFHYSTINNVLFLSPLQFNALDFTPQKTRIAIKNPHVRPPKDPRALLQMPSVEPTPPKPSGQLPVKRLAGVPMAGLGIGIKLPGKSVVGKGSLCVDILWFYYAKMLFIINKWSSASLCFRIWSWFPCFKKDKCGERGKSHRRLPTGNISSSMWAEECISITCLMCWIICTCPLINRKRLRQS